MYHLLYLARLFCSSLPPNSFPTPRETLQRRVWVALTVSVSVGQVAVAEPGTDVSVQRHLAESQTHRHAAQEPSGAASARQRQRAVITE